MRLSFQFLLNVGRLTKIYTEKPSVALPPHSQQPVVATACPHISQHYVSAKLPQSVPSIGKALRPVVICYVLDPGTTGRNHYTVSKAVYHLLTHRGVGCRKHRQQWVFQTPVLMWCPYQDRYPCGCLGSVLADVLLTWLPKSTDVCPTFFIIAYTCHAQPLMLTWHVQRVYYYNLIKPAQSSKCCQLDNSR